MSKQKFIIEIKTFDHDVYFLENHKNGIATWIADKSKALVFSNLSASMTAYNKTAKYAVCNSSCITGI